MKLPTGIYSHCLGHTALPLTPTKHEENLILDKQMGYVASVIVAAIISEGAKLDNFVDIHKKHEMSGIVCGFLPGNGPDPLKDDEREQAYESLLPAARLAAKFADAGVGPAVMVGPMHAHHRNLRSWNSSGFNKWADDLTRLSDEFGLRLLLEPLNSIEDGTPDPFSAITQLAYQRPVQFGIHWDTGHAHARKVEHTFKARAPQIGHFELANVGRSPLHTHLGINFGAYAKLMKYLPHNCTVGVEPFSQEVIKAFDLRELCYTTVEGPAALESDALFLREFGVMQVI